MSNNLILDIRSTHREQLSPDTRQTCIETRQNIDMEHRHGAPPWSVQPCHGALPHQSAACSSHSWTQYSSIPWRHAQPCQLQFMGPHAVPYSFGFGPLQTTAPHLQQKRELDKNYCLVDEKGCMKPFSSVSGISGRYYEDMISKIFESGAPQRLRAVQRQTDEEQWNLKHSKDVIAKFLQERVGDLAGQSMREKGTAEQEAEVDTVYSGSFKNFAESITKVSNVIVGATCTEVKQVLVEICSDSRFVAMKLYQIEIQSCLVQRQGYLVDNAEERQMLTWNETGFAIIVNRAALQIETEKLAEEFGLTNVQRLLKEKKLHIAYFQSEAALPAALSMAREAEKKAAEAKNEVRQLKDGLQGEGLFSVSLNIDCFVCELIWDELQVQFFRSKT